MKQWEWIRNKKSVTGCDQLIVSTTALGPTEKLVHTATYISLQRSIPSRVTVIIFTEERSLLTPCERLPRSTTLTFRKKTIKQMNFVKKKSLFLFGGIAGAAGGLLEHWGDLHAK